MNKINKLNNGNLSTDLVLQDFLYYSTIIKEDQFSVIPHSVFSTLKQLCHDAVQNLYNIDKKNIEDNLNKLK